MYLYIRQTGCRWVRNQVAHIEMSREVARRFNHLYGREPDFEDKAESAAKKMGNKSAKQYFALRKRFQENGDVEALAEGRAILAAQQNISSADRERLNGYLDGGGKAILPEPQALLTPESRMPGLDGEKMSKSYGNVIGLRDGAESVRQKLRTMPTDPARVRRQDPGDPNKCPVWKLHQIYTDTQVREWVQQGCITAGIGCLDCKQPLIDAVLLEQTPIRERSLEYLSEPEHVHNIIAEGCEAARTVARETLRDVRQSMGIQS